MVKGNWERRAELASLRRETAKKAKAERKAGSLTVTAEAAASKLVADTKISENAILSAWLVDGGSDEGSAKSGGDICMAHFRSFEGCTLKKCKKYHPGITIGHLRNLQEFQDKNEVASTGGEMVIKGPYPLRDIKPSIYSAIHFISVDGRCVYDWLNTQQYIDYCNELSGTRGSAMHAANSNISNENALRMQMTGLQLEHVHEEDDEDHNDNDIDIDDKTVVNHSPSVSALETHFTCFAPEYASTTSIIITYLSSYDIIKLKQCSINCKKSMNSNIIARKSIREAEIIYNNNNNKKKKKKKASIHVSTNAKVDSFARGGRSR